MKRLTATLLILVLALSALTGCSNKNTEAPTTNSSETTAAPQTTTSSETTAQAETTAAPSGFELDYSKYLDDFGYIEGVKASEIVPEIDYSKIEIDAVHINDSTEYAISTVINNLTSEFSVEVTDREVRDGDTLSIGYVGKTKEDGVAFDGGSTDATEVTIGVTSYIDGFLPQLIGHRPGETFDIEVTFPDPYSGNAALSGKEAIFTITIHYIKEAPAFDDDFIKAHWDVIADFPGVKEGMTAEELKQRFYDYYYDYYTDSEVYSAVGDYEIDFEVPEEAMLYVENADNCTYYEQYTVLFTDLLKQYYGYSDDQVKEVFQEEARRELLFQAFYEKMGWQIGESEYNEATGSDDNAASIEKLGKGYIARYVMLERALKELRKLVSYKIDEEVKE